MTSQELLTIIEESLVNNEKLFKARCISERMYISLKNRLQQEHILKTKIDNMEIKKLTK